MSSEGIGEDRLWGLPGLSFMDLFGHESRRMDFSLGTKESWGIRVSNRASDGFVRLDRWAVKAIGGRKKRDPYHHRSLSP